MRCQAVERGVFLKVMFLGSGSISVVYRMCSRLRTLRIFCSILGHQLASRIRYRSGLVFEIHGASLNAKGSGILSGSSHKSVRTSDGAYPRIVGEREEALKFRLRGKHHPNNTHAQMTSMVFLYHTSLALSPHVLRLSTPALHALMIILRGSRLCQGRSSGTCSYMLGRSEDRGGEEQVSCFGRGETQMNLFLLLL